MQVTIGLDDDVYELVSAYAAARDITLGSALGELVRRSQPPTGPSRMVMLENGMPFFPANGRVLTPEMVKAAQDDEFDGVSPFDDWLRPEEDEAWAYMQPQQNSPPVDSKFQIGPNGLPILPSRGRRITPEMVKALSEEELG